MKLTRNNYFSKKANAAYMSTSQYKAFEACEVTALAEIKGGVREEKQAFLEGKYFEECLTGNTTAFVEESAQMLIKSGVKRGQLKSNFARVENSARAFKRQSFFMDIISKCEEQKILTGTIAGVKFKGCIDFFNPKTGNCYDTKLLKDFKKVYSRTEKMTLSWYFAYGYHYQAAVYRELVRQNFDTHSEQHILAATKDETPDFIGLRFTSEILNNALEIIKEFAPRYNKVKQGRIAATPCGVCNLCKRTKEITAFEIIEEFD